MYPEILVLNYHHSHYPPITELADVIIPHRYIQAVALAAALILSSAAGSAAQTPIDTLKQLYYSRYDYAQKTLIQVFEDQIRLSDPKSGRGKTLKAPGAGQLTHTFEPFLSQSTLWFVKRGSGLVYTLRNDSIVRTDRSFDHRMQTDAVEFVRNDTLFRQGGYGLWSTVKHITFFDPHTLEWEVERPLNSNIFPPGMYRHQAVAFSNEVWLFGGLTTGQNDPLTSRNNPEVWRYQFNRLEWERMGTINPAVNQFDPALTARVNSDEPGKFILFPVKNQVVAVDLLNNTARFYHQPKVNLHLYFVPHYPPFILEGKVYYYRLLSNTPKKYSASPFYDLEFCSAPAETFTGELIGVQDFYESTYLSTAWLYILLLMGTVGITGGLTVYLRRRTSRIKHARKLTVTKDGVVHGGIVHKLEEKSLAILNKLLQTEGDVYSADIMEMVQNPNLDFSHNTRIKNQLIASLNLEIRTLLGEREDVIQMVRSPIDRRIKTYRIRKELFEIG